MAQQRTDSSPDFPTLAKSAVAGCQFCAFLRTAVLRAKIPALERQEEVAIHLFYAWGPFLWMPPEWDLEEGLHGLFAEVYLALENVHIGTLQFKVYSSDGTSRYECVRGSLSINMSNRCDSKLVRRF
jgi:hypothetical protein